MVEITQTWDSILITIENEDYTYFNDNLITTNKNTAMFGKVFCLHRIKHI